MEGTIIVARYKETNKILTSEIKSGILVSLRFFNGFVLPSAEIIATKEPFCNSKSEEQSALQPCWK